jgi:hypothetical protein
VIGQLPSRLRPLPGPRGLSWSTARRARRRRAHAPRDAARPTCHPDRMLFDAPPAALPVATLRPAGTAPRHEVASLHVLHWLASALRWARPRAVPLVVAFVGMLAVLGATKYLLAFSDPPPAAHRPLVSAQRDPTPFVGRIPGSVLAAHAATHD